MTLSLSSRKFGSLPDGRAVEAWTLCGAGGLLLDVITYGATVTRLLVPDRDGRLADVVLGFDNLSSYLADHAHCGAIAGRVAGRISGARFVLEGTSYELARNDGQNHLHGGIRGLGKRLWTAQPIKQPCGTPSLRLTYRSPNGEEGYPGTVNVTVTYTITDDNVFLIETEGDADQPTPLSLTQHSYFNLAGEASGSIADHELQIYADKFVATNETMTLLDRLESVASHCNDFQEPRGLGAVIPLLFQNHGDLYCIRQVDSGDPKHKLTRAARLLHPNTGRVLEVLTTQPYLQFYTGAGIDSSLNGKSGVPYPAYAGLCLECQGYPNGVNAPKLGDIILRPGHRKCETTAYAFSTTIRKRRVEDLATTSDEQTNE